jgi:cbb3-type cytochrome c oxidase subunit III
MRHSTLAHALASVVVFGVLVVSLAARDPQEHQHPAAGGAHRHLDAAKLKNPVAADATSVAAGKELYEKNCVSCHGATGKGDGKMAETMKTKPADLTDDEWKHGSTDGEIYTVIHGGIKTAGMRAYSPKLTDHQIWDIVNYVRSIGPKKAG